MADDAEHWKSVAEEREAELQELEKMSEALEAELEKEVKDLTRSNEKLKEEKNAAVEKLETLRKESHKKNEKLTKQNIELTDRVQTMQQQLVQLETKNDDFERSERELKMTIESTEAMTEKALEEKAFVQMELEEKKSEVAELEEQVKDLKSEIDVLNQRLSSSSHGTGGAHSNANGQTTLTVPTKRGEALTLLGLLVNRVSALESKLA
eukprot:m.146393 g.146393  ORF g.146393 m.146393 type:complete len:209 (+) comp17770_c0_seq9:202-828(+)